MTSAHAAALTALDLVWRANKTREHFVQDAINHPDIQMGLYPLQTLWDFSNERRIETKCILEETVAEAVAKAIEETKAGAAA
jgi:hypothetical protein